MQKRKILLIISIVVFSSLQNIYATPGNWKIRFEVRHAFKTVDGTLKLNSIPDLKQKLTIEQNKYILKEPIIIKFPVVLLNTANSNRDSHLLETLQYPTYKTASLVINNIEQTNMDRKYLIKGIITLAGKQHIFLSKATVQNHVATGKLSLLLSDFGIEPPNLLFMAVKDKILVYYKIELPKKTVNN